MWCLTWIYAICIHCLVSLVSGVDRCIGCRLCESICPAVCIEVRVGCGWVVSRVIRVFDISYRRCIFCGFCMHVCPVDAIIHSSVCLVFVDLSIFMIISRDVLSVVFCEC